VSEAHTVPKPLDSVAIERAQLRFRRLLLASVALSIVSGIVSVISERFLPTVLRDYLDAQMDRDFSTLEIVAIIIIFPFLAVVIWNVISMYRFRPSARPIALALTALGLLFYLIVGPSVESAVAKTFAEASSMLWGAILAMMFCSPYSELFAANR